jgi:MFS family permease
VGYYGAVQNEESVPQQPIRNILTPNFVLGFLALFAFANAISALIPTLPIFLVRLGSNETEIGILIGVYGIASLVSRLLVGGALLKYSEKSIMMFGALLFAITFITSIVLRPFWPIFVVRLLQGISFACFDTAAFAYIINVIPPAYRGRGIAYFLLAPNFSMVVAPSLGMFLINQYDFTVLFLTCTGLSLCAFLLSWKLKGQEIVTPDKSVAGDNNLFFDLKIIPPALTSFLHNFVWGALVAFMPLYAIKCGVTNPGLFFSSIAVMFIVSRMLGGRILDTYSKEKIILLCILTAMIAILILSFSKTLSMFIFVGLLWGIGVAFFFPASMSYAFDYACSSGGTAIGTFRALTDLGLALGPVIMGIVIPLTSYRIMFLSLVFICLINLSYFQFYVRKRAKVFEVGS